MRSQRCLLVSLITFDVLCRVIGSLDADASRPQAAGYPFQRCFRVFRCFRDTGYIIFHAGFICSYSTRRMLNLLATAWLAVKLYLCAASFHAVCISQMECHRYLRFVQFSTLRLHLIRLLCAQPSTTKKVLCHFSVSFKKMMYPGVSTAACSS